MEIPADVEPSLENQQIHNKIKYFRFSLTTISILANNGSITNDHMKQRVVIKKDNRTPKRQLFHAPFPGHMTATKLGFFLVSAHNKRY